MDSKSDARKRGDQFFKELVHNKYVLASLLGDCVSEFRGLSREQVIDYLPLEGNGETVIGSKTELFSISKGPIIMDSVFQIKSPKGELGLIVAVEGQGNGMDKESLANRQQYYLCRLVDEQSLYASNKDELYSDMRKTVCIWVRLSPSAKNRNSILVHRFGLFKKDEDMFIGPSSLNKMEVIEVNLGLFGDEYGADSIGVMSTLFDKNLDDSMKDHLLKDKYKIVLRESIIREARAVGALAEEFEIYERTAARRAARMAEEAYAEGMDKGLKEGRNEEREMVTSILADAAFKLCKEQSLSPEEAVDRTVQIPEYRQIVLDKVLMKLEKTE